MICCTYESRAVSRFDIGLRIAFSVIELVIVIAILAVLAGLTVSAVQRFRDVAARSACANNVRQIGLALHRYHGHHDSLPPGVMPYAPVPQPGSKRPADGYPLLNWHGRLLPFIEQEPLWAETETAYAEDWHEIKTPPHTGFAIFLPVFMCPSEIGRWAGAVQKASAPTSYLGVSGTNDYRKNGLLYLSSKVRFAQITDGLSHTLMVGERPPGLELYYGRWYGGWGPWGMANAFLGVRETDVPSVGASCHAGPYHFMSDQVQNECSIFHFWSQHLGGANFLFADGSVHFLRYSADPIMPALATRGGGEAVTVPD